jgi:hypothetical protein
MSFSTRFDNVTINSSLQQLRLPGSFFVKFRMAQRVDDAALMDLVTPRPPSREHDETRENYGRCVLTFVLISRKNNPQKIANRSLSTSGGGGGIRTRGTFPFSGFQDRCNKPLYHPSYELMFGAELLAFLPRNLRQFSGDKSNPCGLVRGPTLGWNTR